MTDLPSTSATCEFLQTLAVHQPGECTKALHVARSQSLALHAEETEIFGASHAVVGACLRGI